MKKKDKLIMELIIIKLRNSLCKNIRMEILKKKNEFVKYLQEQRPGKRLAIFGDGATYHNSQ